MPVLLEHIDAIARQKQRDVMYLEFHAPGKSLQLREDHDWRNDPMRDTVCQWLTGQGIAWTPCGHFANEGLMMGYRGQIYIDVPYDESDPQYQQLTAYLEHEDGSMRYPTVTFCYVLLANAMKNAHHDEPDFWENWAENF